MCQSSQTKKTLLLLGNWNLGFPETENPSRCTLTGTSEPRCGTGLKSGRNEPIVHFEDRVRNDLVWGAFLVSFHSRECLRTTPCIPVFTSTACSYKSTNKNARPSRNSTDREDELSSQAPASGSPFLVLPWSAGGILVTGSLFQHSRPCTLSLPRLSNKFRIVPLLSPSTWKTPPPTALKLLQTLSNYTLISSPRTPSRVFLPAP